MNAAARLTVSAPVITSEEVKTALKQRFPLIMVDCVVSLEKGKSIRAIKNVTINEVYCQRHSGGQAVLPPTLIVEAIGQSASILFIRSTGFGTHPQEFLVLGSIQEMTFLKPVIPGDRMEIEAYVSKFVGAYAIVRAVVTVDQKEVAKGSLGFALRTLPADLP